MPRGGGRISTNPAFVRPPPLRLERVQPDPGGVHAPPRPHRAGGQGRQAAEFQLSARCCCRCSRCTLAFGGDAEIRTLKGAEWVGGQVMPTGDALLSGYYLNELLLRLLARDDPHPGAVRRLCGRRAGAGERACRRTGCSRGCGRSSCCCCARSACCRAGRADRHAGAAGAGRATACVPEGGLVLAADGEGQPGRRAVAGAAGALDDRRPSRHAARSRRHAPELKPQLRALLHYHCGVSTLRTRQLMMDLQAL
jgi:DNA repair protein RecO (recombination protein O)